MTITPPSNKLTEGEKESFRAAHESYLKWKETEEGQRVLASLKAKQEALKKERGNTDGNKEVSF